MKEEEKRIRLRQIGERLIDALYPPVCPVCMKVIWERNARICTKCREKLVVIEEPLCKRCGKPVDDDRAEYCSDCNRHEHYFDAGRGVFLYKGDIKKSIYNFKYNNKREFVKFFGDEIIENLGRWIADISPDVLIPVPLYPKKERMRGYNQAELIARYLGEKLNIPVEPYLIERRINTLPQKELSADSRKKNMKKAFNIAENIVKLNIAMVVDDIYTTGATADAVSRLLKEAGVREVYVLTICAGNGF